MAEMNISEWFKDRPAWIKDAARRLLENDSLSNQDYEELFVLCKQEAIGTLNIDCLIPQNVFGNTSANKLKLNSIGNIQGINALSPKVPLQFGKGNLAVVYGQNRAGKSGYVRILKHTCGARHPGPLHPNVYQSRPTQQKCTVEYQKDDVPVTCDWNAANGSIDDLTCVDVFDAGCGKVYIADENEVTYEPPVLLFFSDLISVCEKVSSALDAEIGNQTSKKPALPPEYAGTNGGKWYEKLSGKTKNEELKHCSWTDQGEKKLSELQKRLSEKAPAEKARKIRQKQQHIQDLINDTKKYLNQLSDENCRRIIFSKKKVILAKNAAKVAAEKVFSGAPLEGVGCDTWQKLWEYAKNYSQQQAYVGSEFPVISDGSRCVLCQQPFSEDAKIRMKSFEEFVKGAAKKEAEAVESSFEKELNSISEIPTLESLKTKADAAGLMQGEEPFPLDDLYIALQTRKDQLSKPDVQDKLNPLISVVEWISGAKQIIADSEETAKKYDEDAKADNREDLLKQLNELQTKKWLSQQVKSIEEEIERFKLIDTLQSAKKLANTRVLSIKKGELAKSLITNAFVFRFNSELKNLGASQIKIEFIKSRVNKGRVLHKLCLQGAINNSPDDILSEGEHRIVALSAFLADVTGKQHSAPFVFDDPISSLDQAFEETVVQRLIELSSDRQVIVFTHRLSLLGLVQDYAKKANIEPEIVCIRKETWGTGEPGDTPLFAKKPEKALNNLLNNKLPKARKLLIEHGQEVYDPYAKALCSDFRILIERMVECDLLADVVQRYRRAINTMGKIEKLANINDSDCTLFDQLMTKYSRYEHSQPLEAPVAIPTPDEMENDFKSLKNWHVDFNKKPLVVSRGLPS